jgi:hypothetical protein
MTKAKSTETDRDEESVEGEVLPPSSDGPATTASLVVERHLNRVLADLGGKVAEVMGIPPESWPPGRRVKFEVPFVVVPASITVTIENTEDQ